MVWKYKFIDCQSVTDTYLKLLHFVIFAYLFYNLHVKIFYIFSYFCTSGKFYYVLYLIKLKKEKKKHLINLVHVSKSGISQLIIQSLAFADVLQFYKLCMYSCERILLKN